MKPQTRSSGCIAASPHDVLTGAFDKRNVRLKQKERERYDEVYDKTFKQIMTMKMIHGTVVGMTKTDVCDQYWIQRWTGLFH